MTLINDDHESRNPRNGAIRQDEEQGGMELGGTDVDPDIYTGGLDEEGDEDEDDGMDAIDESVEDGEAG